MKKPSSNGTGKSTKKTVSTPKKIMERLRQKRQTKIDELAKTGVKFADLQIEPQSPIVDVCALGDIGGDASWDQVLQPIDPGSFRDCSTQDQVRECLKGSHDYFFYKALKGIETRVLPDEVRHMFKCLLLDPVTTPARMLANRDLMLRAYDELAGWLIVFARANPTWKFKFVTLIDGDDGCSLNKPLVKLFSSQVKAKSVLRAIAPKGHYFAITEMGFFSSITHPDGGAHLQTTTHAIVVAEEFPLEAKVIERHDSKFSANVTDARPIDISPFEDNTDLTLSRMAAYLFKAPHKSMNYCPPHNGRPGHINHSEKSDRYICYTHMALLRMMLTFGDCTFAVDKGQDIRSTITKILGTMCDTESPPNRRLIHPDAIAAFVVELAKALGKDHWTLPVIERSR